MSSLIKFELTDGDSFRLCRSTINQYPETMLSRMISTNIGDNDKENTFYIDCDSDTFKLIINYYQNSVIDLSKLELFKLYELIFKADYYGLDDLAMQATEEIFRFITLNGHIGNFAGIYNVGAPDIKIPNLLAYIIYTKYIPAIIDKYRFIISTTYPKFKTTQLIKPIIILTQFPKVNYLQVEAYNNLLYGNNQIYVKLYAFEYFIAINIYGCLGKFKWCIDLRDEKTYSLKIQLDTRLNKSDDDTIIGEVVV